MARPQGTYLDQLTPPLLRSDDATNEMVAGFILLLPSAYSDMSADLRAAACLELLYSAGAAGGQ